jgi:hypothetical protein
LFKAKYILPFTNDLNELYEVYFEFLDYEGDVIELTGSEDALKIQSTTGDENKLEPILGTEALIGIMVEEDTPISISDLVASQDNQIRVTIYRDEDYTKSVFQGFVVVEDNSQPFLDPPFTLSARALDGLGLLKGVDLTDLNDLRFVGNFSVLSWIVQILYKTGQTINLRVYFNFFESSFSQTAGALEQVYLNAITFSQGDAFNVAPDDPTIDINATSADDCYTALEKIVRCFRCRLFQEDGVWNLVSLYEYLNPSGSSYKEYALGEPVDGVVPYTAIAAGQNKNYSAAVGRQQLIHPVLEDQVIYLKLATKWIKLTYTYDQSQNKVCNQDFSEGDRDATYDEVISSSIIDATINPVVNLTTQGYDLYCFDAFEGQNNDSVTGGPYPSQAATFKFFIRDSVDQLGFSLLRNAVIGNSTDGKVSYIRTKRFLIDTSDILQISYSWRRRVGVSNDFNDIYVFLYGDDGTFWAMNGILPANPATTWQQVGSDFRRSGFNTVPFLGTGATPGVSNTWNSVSFNQTSTSANPFAKTPVSGQVEILFPHSGVGGVQETWIKDLSITIVPYLQGSYTQLKGDYNYSGSNNAIKQTESDDVEIGDSPKRYFKGALLRSNGDLCSPTWKRAGIPESFRFTQLMERIMYNHLYRMNHKIEGTFRCLVYQPQDDPYVIRMNGYLGKYTFSESDDPTKQYMLTSFEKDYATGQWRGVFVETIENENADPFVLPDQFKFSYIFQ